MPNYNPKQGQSSAQKKVPSKSGQSQSAQQKGSSSSAGSSQSTSKEKAMKQ